MFLVLLLASAVTVLDVATKMAVMTGMVEGQSIPIIDGLLALHYIRNSGAAYGLLSGQRWLLVIITAGVAAGLFWYARQARSILERTGLSVLLGGAVGNLINRVLWGPVTDLIEIIPLSSIFQVFNMADIAITFGVILFVWGTLRQPRTT